MRGGGIWAQHRCGAHPCSLQPPTSVSLQNRERARQAAQRWTVAAFPLFAQITQAKQTNEQTKS